MDNTQFGEVLRILIFVGVLICLYFLVKMTRKKNSIWKSDIPEYLNQMAKVKAIDYAPSGIITINSSGSILSWNRGATEIFGYTEEEMLAKPLTKIMPERFRIMHTAGLEKARYGGGGDLIGKTTRLEGLRKSGKEFPVKLTLWQWKEGPNIYYTGIVRDMSEDMLLTERDNTLLGIYKEAEIVGNFGVSSWDILRDIVVFSDGFKNLFNLDKNQSDSVNILKHIYYEDKPLVEAALKKLFDDKKGYEIEYRIVDVSGKPRKVRSKTKPYLDGNGALVRVVALIREIDNNGNNSRGPSLNSGK